MPKWIYICLLYLGVFCISGSANLSRFSNFIANLQHTSHQTKDGKYDCSKEIPEDQQEENRDELEKETKLFHQDGHLYLKKEPQQLTCAITFFIKEDRYRNAPKKDLVTPPPNF
ncbi:MAG: hypothetical protein JNM95_12605 [Chitinophagaceae bacterium]|nr:hypothetical protein [Chitinophagaceae bacterium]